MSVTLLAPWQQHTPGDGVPLGNQAQTSTWTTLWKIRNKEGEKKMWERPSLLHSAKPESIKRSLAVEWNLRPPAGFTATVSLSVPHSWERGGVKHGFRSLFWEVLQLCAAGEEHGLSQTKSWVIKAAGSDSAGSRWRLFTYSWCIETLFARV